MKQKRIPPYGKDISPGNMSEVDYLGAVQERKKALESLEKMRLERPLKPPGKR